ncbi:MAG: 3,4-dihydroxy-2-butanone-4-phosphate synthase [Puniceicoccaceae bacterium]|nr:MAG: 3,4-dihydroxy-2-butanone-4-phosphate synthase [Puniceicoccaceae bacterium]
MPKKPSSRTPGFDPVEAAIEAIAAGKPVIVTDDEGRENEGDLVMAAGKATPETINLMIREARGLICVPTTGYHLHKLGIGPMVPENREAQGTDFSVSVDAAEGITTGISAYDRCRTVRLLADPETRPEQLVQPGHIFPLKARPGGVLERAGHTEAAVDLASLAGLHPSAVICEILNDDGTMARLPELRRLKRRLKTPLISIAALIEYRHQRECLVEKTGERPFASEYGRFTLHYFRNTIDGRRHFAFSLGELGPEPTLVRVHGGDLLADLFRPLDSSRHLALEGALKAVATSGRGVVLYMQRSSMEAPAAGRGAPQPTPGDHHPMGFREYGIGAQILVALGLRRIRLLSTTPRRVVGLDGYGLEIVEQLPIPGLPEKQTKTVRAASRPKQAKRR